MTFLRIIPVICFCFLFFCFPAMQKDFPAIQKQKMTIVKDSLKKFYKSFLPKSKFRDQVVKHTAFSLCYVDAYEQAKWVAYRLTAEMCLNKEEERTDNFRSEEHTSELQS